MKQTVDKHFPRFILLDDDVFALAIAEKVIRNYKRCAGIVKFSAAKDAIEYIGAKDFMTGDIDTVFLTDLHMPGIDGFTLLDHLEHTTKLVRERLHIFVLSAAASPDEVRRVFSYSYVIGFLSKPFSKDKMEQIINCVLYPL